MAAGITQPGGAGTTIYIYDDSDTSGGRAAGAYTFAQISAAFPLDFVDNGTNEKSYRAKVSLQVGDTGTGAATTTLTDTASDVIWDAGKTLIYRATQTSSWNTNLGTKVGTGNAASGRLGSKLSMALATAQSFRGLFKFYGATIRSTGSSISFVPVDNNGSELVNCIVELTNATGNALGLGTPGLSVSNLYNVDVVAATTGTVVNLFAVNAAERITIGAPTPTCFIGVNAVVQAKDIRVFGSPTTSDFRWAGSGAINWILVRPVFSGNAAKFSSSGAAVPSLANSTKEYWEWDVKVVDRTGIGLAGIPVTLTDSTGAVQVDTTTASDGTLTYGTGLTASAVIVADHYIVNPSIYTIRHRSPFDVKINMPSQTGYNSNYPSRHYKFYWHGYETYTTSSGNFEDMVDVVALEEQSGNPTTWVECEMP